MFRDGNVYYEKIMKMAVTDGKTYQLRKAADKISEDQLAVRNRVEIVFEQFL